MTGIRIHGAQTIGNNGIENLTLPVVTSLPSETHLAELWFNNTLKKPQILIDHDQGSPIIRNLTFDESLHPVAFSGNFNELTNKPLYPTKLSQLENDTGYVTSTNSGVTSVNNKSGAVTLGMLDLSGKGTACWRDLPMEIIVKGTGSTSPVWTQLNSKFSAYKFDVGSECWGNAHINHDYKEGSGIYVHIHFSTSGVSIRPVTWQVDWTVAKGHNQSNYDLNGQSVVLTQTPHGSAFRHYVTEVAIPLTSAEFEPDAIIRIHLKRIANGGVENTDNVFVDFMDFHYQTDRFATINRSPNFNV